MSKWTHVEINDQGRVVSRMKHPPQSAINKAYGRGHRVVVLPAPGAILLGATMTALPPGSWLAKPQAQP